MISDKSLSGIMLPSRTTPLLLLLFAMLVYAGFAPSVQGNPIYTLGVKAGDGAWYGYSGIDVPLKLHITVLNVTDTTITANFTNYYSDGNANSTVQYLNIFSGDRNTDNILFAIGTGLKVGDPVYNNYATISSVQTQSCGGVSRSLDYIAFSQGVQLYWDQNTGIMCKYNDNTQSESLIMFNTTLWNSHPQPVDAFLVGFEVSTFLGAPLVVLIVFVFLRKRRRARK